jgi:Tol biopolymer transport system component
MKTSHSMWRVPLGLLVTTILSVNALAQKGGPKPPTPPPAPFYPAIAFSDPTNSQSRWDLVVMDANGANSRVVYAKKFSQNVGADWSPDGKYLIFQSDDVMGTADGLYLINVDGSGLKKIRPSGREPAWSPVPVGGEYRIAFSDRALNEDGTWRGDYDAFMVKLDGSGSVRLTDTPGISESHVEWSPGGDRITVQTYNPTTSESDLLLYQLDCAGDACGLALSGSVTNVPGSPLAGKDVGVSWARSHDILLASANTGVDGSYDLWTITLGSPVTFEQLTDTLAASEYDESWLPDDSAIAFVRGPEGYLWQMSYLPNPDGSRTLQLIATPRQVGVSRFWGLKWRRNP